jgi:hypothetical protein
VNLNVMTIEELVARLGALSDLPSGWDGSGDGIWDGGGAPAPNALAIQRAGDVARAITKRPHAVDPDANGGIAIWYYGPDRRDVACYCRNSGDIAIVSYRSGMWTDQVTLRLSVTELLKIEHVAQALASAIEAAEAGVAPCLA